MRVRIGVTAFALAGASAWPTGLSAQHEPIDRSVNGPTATAPDSTRAPRQARQRRAPSLIADSIALAGDSAGALKYLDEVLKRTPRDGSVLHKKAMIAWAMARSDRESVVQDVENVRLLMAADSALHLATTFAPDSGRFWTDLAQFYLSSRVVFQRFRAQNYLKKGLGAALKVEDSLLVSEISDEIGMVNWRRYEMSANKILHVESGVPPAQYISSRQLTNDPSKTTKWKVGNAVDSFLRNFQIVDPPTGMQDYHPALEHFTLARSANPLSARARRHFYMALAEKNQWNELLADASDVLKTAPWDYEAWTILGMANTRLNKPAEAAAAFDSALTMMTPEARRSFTDLNRLLPRRPLYQEDNRQNAQWRARQTEAERRTGEELYWMLSDPVARTTVNENRIEFYTRVAYSNLRWSSDEFGLLGADSDRGDIYVRYGPPDLLGGPFWVYYFGVVFAFAPVPTFGVARTAWDQRTFVKGITAVEPVRWDNVAATSRLDTMTVRVARFRATPDSMDVVTAVGVPASRMFREVDLAGTMPIALNMRVIDPRAQIAFSDSLFATVRAEAPPVLVNQSWTHRYGPGGNVVRVDAFQPDTRRAARGMATVDATREHGFGMSDILMGLAPRNVSTAAVRWRDAGLTPSAGQYRIGDPVGLVWETYDLVPKDGQAHYFVNILIEPAEGSAFGKFAVRILGNLSDKLNRQIEGSTKLLTSLDRTVPASPVTVDSYSLTFSNAAPGTYRVTVEVVDMNSKLTRERTTTIRFVR